MKLHSCTSYDVSKLKVENFLAFAQADRVFSAFYAFFSHGGV